MALIFIGVGSNIDRENNIRAGIGRLREEFDDVQLSPIYETEAIGFEGENFFNLVVSMRTELEPDALQIKLHSIEHEFGRVRGGPRFAARTLDLDLLLFDDRVCDTESLQLPREDVHKFAFVLCPLAQLAPDEHHPVMGKTYTQLWDEFDKSEQELWLTELDV